MTAAEYNELLAQCDFRQPKQVSELVSSTHTEVMFDQKVQERTVKNVYGAYNYFGGLLGKEEWPDGQGMDLVREYYCDPHVPFSFSQFVRQAAICDPNLANECDRDRCKVPEGGRGTLPGFVFFKWGLETERDCIANIRHIRQFRYWAAKVIRSRELIDEQFMNMFYTMAGIHTCGMKVTMQGVRNADGTLSLAGNTNPRNPVRGGLFNYMEEKFMAPTNVHDMVPLTPDTLDALARHWTQFPKGNEIARGPRNEPIFEFWYPDDWYRDEAIKHPDFNEKMKIMWPNKMFSGYTNAPGEREVLGNFAARVMPWLPRLAPTADGELVAVDTHVGVDIEVGKEYVGSLDFENAPIGVAAMVSGKQGTILTRPDLTTSGAGFPIMPITGNGPWRIRNDYDPTCNKDLNKPYSQKDYEMGVRLDDPGAAIAFLFRRRVFQSRPINECDLAPIFMVEKNEVNCALTTIGCQTGKSRESDSFTKHEGAPLAVTCTAVACGNGDSSPYTYIVKVDRRANMPGYNSLGCACGSTVKLYIYDENGDFSREITGIYKSDAMSFPYARYFIETETELLATECIKGIACADSTILQGNVLDDWDAGDGNVGYALDDSIVCGEGDDVLITYYDANGVVLGTISGVIESYNPDSNIYVISSENAIFKEGEVYAGQASVGISCNEAPNASSSSSSGE